MERIASIDRLNEISNIQTYLPYLRQLKWYIIRFHDMKTVAKDLGIPEEVLSELLNDERPFHYDTFLALMDILEIEVTKKKTYEYEE
jgi:DNA-binding phage protein